MAFEREFNFDHYIKRSYETSRGDDEVATESNPEPEEDKGVRNPYAEVDKELMAIRDYAINTRKRVMEVQAKLDAFIESLETPSSPMIAYARMTDENVVRRRETSQETEKDFDIAEAKESRREICDELYGDCC